MFLLFCVLLFTGSLIEGLPMKRERYQRIRCRPGDNSVACFKEQSLFEQGQISNQIDTNPVSKRLPSIVIPEVFPVEENGSGVFSGEGPESKEYDSESNEIKDYKFQQNLSEENLIY
ncbi:serglycin [Gastrophryne carolinensis]